MLGVTTSRSSVRVISDATRYGVVGLFIAKRSTRAALSIPSVVRWPTVFILIGRVLLVMIVGGPLLRNTLGLLRLLLFLLRLLFDRIEPVVVVVVVVAVAVATAIDNLDLGTDQNNLTSVFTNGEAARLLARDVWEGSAAPVPSSSRFYRHSHSHSTPPLSSSRTSLLICSPMQACQ